MFRLFNWFRHDVISDLLDKKITVENFYRQLYVYVVFVTVGIFTLSLIVDALGFNGVNIILVPVWVIVIGYIGLHPTYILLALTTGGVATTARNAERERIIDGIKAAAGEWKKYLLHFAMFGGVFFLTRFIVSIREYPFAGMVLLAATITLGLWSWVYETKAVYYRRYVLALITVVITIGLFGAVSGDRPARGEHPMAPMHNSLHDIVNNIMYNKTLEFEVSDLNGKYKAAGTVKPGTRKCSVPERQYVLLVNTNTSVEINQHIRVNNARPGDDMEVASDGEVMLKFVGRPEFLNQPIDYQTLVLKCS